MKVDHPVDDKLTNELTDELAAEHETPEFHVRHAGRVTMLEASKGVDWLSMFPDEPAAANAGDSKPLIDAPPVIDSQALIDVPRLIDVPPLPESPAPSAADDPLVGRSVAVLYPPGPKRVPRAAIALSVLALAASVTVLYLVFAPIHIEPSEAPATVPTSASNDRLTAGPRVDDRIALEALAPAAVKSPTPRSAPVNLTARSGRGRAAAPQKTSTPSPPTPTPRTPAPSPTPSRTRSAQASAASAPALTPIALSTPRPTPTATPATALELTPPPSPTPSPSPLTTTAPLAGTVPAPRPAATPLSPSPRPSPSPTPTPNSATETTAVRTVLDQYRAAYESLRSESVKAVWPAANTRALARAFDQIASQSVEFDSCGIELNAAGAEANCVGRVTFVPKVGGKVPRVESRRWTFYLRRQNDRWIIDRVVSR